MLKQMLIVLGILLVFGCADVPTSKEQFVFSGCYGGSDSVEENQYIAPDTTAPTISSPPTSGATDVSVSADITVPFSEEMDSSTINFTNITVVDGSGNAVSGVWSYSGTTATFNPSSDLSYSTTYTVTVGTGVKDSSGNFLRSASSWNFSTSYPKIISAGGVHSCAAFSDGSAKCWGDNEYGQLGDGTTTASTTPVTVTSINTATSIAAGNGHTCVLLADSTIKCWGRNEYGQLGNRTTTNSNSPATVFGISDAIAISTGNLHTCALLADSTIKCWGLNSTVTPYASGGQLGDGSITTSTKPVSVYGIDDATAVSAGQEHTCALLADSTIKCWGYNWRGSIGDGTNTMRTRPVDVTGITNAAGISLGNIHTCAVLKDGSAVCWGTNSGGELGNGTTTNSFTPVGVSGISNATSLSAGQNHNCAILAEGSIRCWGSNAFSQLGDETTVNRTTPVGVSGISNATSISTGGPHTCVLLSNKDVKCWGYNFYGQLGDGSNNNSITPVTVQF